MASLPFSSSLETQNKGRRVGRQLCVREQAGDEKTKLALRSRDCMCRLLFVIGRTFCFGWIGARTSLRWSSLLLLLFLCVKTLNSGFFFSDHAAVFRLPDAKQKKRNCGCGDIEFCFAGNFCFRFPSEELRRQKERQEEPNRKGDDDH